MTFLLTAAVFSALATEDKIQVPIRGIQCDDCVAPVQRALEGAAGVRSARVAKIETTGVWIAELTLRERSVVRVKDLNAALAGARKGFSFEVDESMSVELVYYATVADPGTDAFKSLPGYKSSRVHESIVAPVYQGEKIPTMAELRKALGATDFALAPQKDGVRYASRTKIDVVSSMPGDGLDEIQASRIVKKKDSC